MRRTAKKSFWIFLGAVLAAFIISCGGNAGGDDDGTCGNGVCDKGEDIILLTEPVQFKCAQDCAGVCGDGVCNTCFENKDNCPQDCN